MLGHSGRVRIGAVALLASFAALMALAACQLIAGTGTRELNPEHAGCALPTGSGPSVRIANLVPTADVVDVCIRPAGGSWGEPIVLSGGTDCGSSKYFGSAAAAGFAYKQLSVPFSAPAATIDVKMVPAGRACSATGLTEGDGLKLEAGAVTTIARIGGNGVRESIVALPENDKPNPDATAIRFVHAMPGVGPLDLGATTATALPTTVDNPLVLKPIAYGTAPPAGTPTIVSPIGSNGYFGIPTGMYNIVAGVHGATPEKALFLQVIQYGAGATYSLYGIGVAKSNKYPQQALLCPEGSPPQAASNPLLLSCTSSALPTISVDVYNPALYGPNAPNFSTRESYFLSQQTSPIASMDTDILCLVELDSLNDLKTIASIVGPADAGTGGNGAFPYSYWVQTNLDTPLSNPKDQNGNTPPAPTTPPCGGNTDQNALNNAYTCMVQNCSTRPGDPTGTLAATTNCLSQKCIFPLGVLQGYPQCFDCMIDYVASQEEYGTSLNACTTQVKQPYGYEGQLSTMILSRYPLTATDSYILPSTNYRRGALYAKVQLEDQAIDFYCGFFISTLIATDLPYTGNYGADGGAKDPTGAGAYGQEQNWEATQLVTWIKQKSGNNPAIVVGDWRSSVGVAGLDGGTPLDGGMFSPPTDLVPRSMAILGGALTPVAASDWVPQCDYCPGAQNILNAPGTDSYFVQQPFLYNWPGMGNPVVDEKATFTTAEVDIGGGMQAPPSPYYGLEFHVIRPVQ